MESEGPTQSLFARIYQAATHWYFQTEFARKIGSAVSKTFTLPQLNRLAAHDIPWSQLGKPISESTVVLISTGGVHLQTDRPFNLAGDPTFREIPGDAEPNDLAISHLAYDTTDAIRDINLVFPLERLRELADEEAIGRVADVHYGFGFMPNAAKLTSAAKRVARRLRHADVDLALLVPA